MLWKYRGKVCRCAFDKRADGVVPLPGLLRMVLPVHLLPLLAALAPSRVVDAKAHRPLLVVSNTNSHSETNLCVFVGDQKIGGIGITRSYI